LPEPIPFQISFIPGRKIAEVLEIQFNKLIQAPGCLTYWNSKRFLLKNLFQGHGTG
jgi:hypothetical protein